VAQPDPGEAQPDPGEAQPNPAAADCPRHPVEAQPDPVEAQPDPGEAQPNPAAGKGCKLTRSLDSQSLPNPNHRHASTNPKSRAAGLWMRGGERFFCSSGHLSNIADSFYQL